MKILTLNTWQKRGPWQDRWRVTVQGVKQFKPDILAFQEVFDTEVAEWVKRETGYPYLVFPTDRSGQMFLSRHPVLNSALLQMETQSPTEEYFRYVLYMLVEVGKEPVAFYNTHLSWRLEEGQVRERQVGELLRFIDDNSPDIETAVMGDFNAPPETSEIKSVFELGAFTDAYATARPGDRGITWDNENPYVREASVVLPDRRIDYLFFRHGSGSLKHLKSAELVFTRPDENGVYASDHYGLLVEFG